MSEPVLERTEFVHFRFYNKEGKLLPRGGATVGYIPNPDTGKAVLTVAVCSPRENFCRRIGKNICAGRAGTSQVEMLTRNQLLAAADTVVDSKWYDVANRRGYKVEGTMKRSIRNRNKK